MLKLISKMHLLIILARVVLYCFYAFLGSEILTIISRNPEMDINIPPVSN